MLFYNTCPVYTGIDIDFYSLTTGFWFKLYNIIYTQCSKSATKSRPKKKKRKKGGHWFYYFNFKIQPLHVRLTDLLIIYIWKLLPIPDTAVPTYPMKRDSMAVEITFKIWIFALFSGAPSDMIYTKKNSCNIILSYYVVRFTQISLRNFFWEKITYQQNSRQTFISLWIINSQT